MGRRSRRARSHHQRRFRLLDPAHSGAAVASPRAVCAGHPRRVEPPGAGWSAVARQLRFARRGVCARLRDLQTGGDRAAGCRGLAERVRRRRAVGSVCGGGCGHRVCERHARHVLLRTFDFLHVLHDPHDGGAAARRDLRVRDHDGADVSRRGISKRMSDKSEHELLLLERKYCSFGDTVHYLEPPKAFERSEGSYLYDGDGTPYLDLQMWYSAVNFGYGNARLNTALVRQLNKLPQLACQYLHSEKIELAAAIARLNASKFGVDGRVHFNVGGAQAIEDSLKIVRNATGKNLVFAFMGGYHGRTLAASAITSSYRYRRRFGHFSDRAHFVPFPYCFRCPYDKN